MTKLSLLGTVFGTSHDNFMVHVSRSTWIGCVNEMGVLPLGIFHFNTRCYLSRHLHDNSYMIIGRCIFLISV